MSEYRFVSIDSSTNKTGMALFVDGKLSDYHLIDKHTIKDAEERMNQMCLEILQTLKIWKPKSCRIEHPQGQGKNVLAVGMLCEIIGAVRIYCLLNKCDFSEVTPSVWRKHLGIDQGLKVKREQLKQQAIDRVKEYFSIDVNDDLADAICIGISMIKEYNQK